MRPFARSSLRSLLARQEAAVVLMWLVAASVLSQATGRVTDWFDMTDEMRYERLAISVAQTGSLLPRIHGMAVRDLDQLYPAFLAVFFRHGTVSHDLHQAHIAGAWVMSSACVPAFLLGRAVTRRGWVGWFLALCSLMVPWLLYSSFLLTEVVAYPAFLWAFYASHKAVVARSRRADLFAVAAIVVAFFARTELLVFAVVLPLAVVAVELSSSHAEPFRRVAMKSLGRAVRSHLVLCWFYGLLVLAAAVFAATGGHLLDLSAYGQEVPSGLLPPGLGRAFAGYIAQLAFAMGLLPFVAGCGWLLANLNASSSIEARAFAWVATLSFSLMTFEVTKYSLGVGGVIYERFLFYFVPVILLAFVNALLDRRRMAWSLLLPLALVIAGFASRIEEPYTWRGGRVNPDTPISLFYHPLLETFHSTRGMQIGLILSAAIMTGVFSFASQALAHRRALVGLLLVVTASAMALASGYVWVRLFRTIGNSDRPLTAPVPATLDWVDSALGRHASVTVVPYHVSTDYFVDLDYWRDLEFWNESVDRSAEYSTTAPIYDYTGVWFPKLDLQIDPVTGSASISPTHYVIQSVGDTRFQLAGNVQVQNQDTNLIDADEPWRASFLTLDTFDDGWLKPHTPATIRIFPIPGQKRARTYYLSLQVQAPSDVSSRAFTATSNLKTVRATASGAQTTFVNQVPICVAPHHYAAVTISARDSSPIPGDLSTLSAATSASPSRDGSVLLADASVSDDLGPPCAT